MSFNHESLAVAKRGDHVECIHRGSVAVVDTQGRLIAYAGDPGGYTFSRSALKPFQALPFTLAGGITRFGFTQQQTALMCASHSGEEMHVKGVSDMLEKAGCTEHDLGCGCHLPERFANGEAVPPDFAMDQRHNNCSGKHAGFLAFCQMGGHSRHDYLDPSHTLQREIVKVVSDLSGTSPTQFWYGTDGCNAPNIGLPLSRLAKIWARFGAASKDGDELDRAMATLADAMMEWPGMYSGTGRADEALTSVGKGKWVSKTGAQGVRCIGTRKHGVGIALKVGDGDYSTAYAVSIEVMRQLGIADDATVNELQGWLNPDLRNCNGHKVGQLSCDFRLKYV
ncbi:asparaginase [Paraburkholderia mimosarum]|uniref:asparaginase n=1 Tax=Paraburkholderia mimosarum TaxID=312026 RepID=UPI0039C180A2